MEEKSLGERRTLFKVYDMPVELINWYIAYAKLNCDNQVWKVLELGRKLIEERDKEAKNLKEKVKELEKRVEALEMSMEKKVKRTWGGDVVE